MAILVSDITDRLGLILHDEDHIRWTEDELIDWINDAAAEIVIRRPPARTVTETVTLVAGALQTIPDGGLQLMDVKRNVSSAKKYPIQRASKNAIEAYAPDWYDKASSTYVRNYCIDDRQPREFYVYPAVAEGVQVSISYSAPPELVTATTDSLDLSREYMGPLVSYCLYRALSKDFELGNSPAAAAHYQAFAEALGANTQTQLVVSPKASEA